MREYLQTSANAIAGYRGVRVLGLLAASVAASVLGALSGFADPSPASGNQQRFLHPPSAPQGATIANTDFSLDRGLGLFVGVNEFDDKSLTPLTYAVNDAIGLANYFIVSGLIEPANCHLLLSGVPVGPAATRQLEELKAKGVQPEEATYHNILDKVRLLTKAGAANFIVMSFGTHGFDDGRTSYFMPKDGSRSELRDFGISTEKIDARLQESGAKKAILLVDACRAKTFTGTRGDGPNVMSDPFRAAFDAANAHATLLACDKGQVSYESDDFKQGVFTHFLLEGLNGHAKVNERGFITLGTLIDFVSAQVRTWVQQERSGAGPTEQQKPTWSGANEYRETPIARSAEVDKEFTKIATERGAAMDLLTHAYRDPVLQAKFGDGAFTEISFALIRLPADPQVYATSPLGQIIQMVNGQLQQSTPSSVEALVTWWNARKAELSQGTVRIVTDPPGAVLIVDGIKTSLVTPVDSKLPSGQRRIMVSLPGHESFEKTVVVEPGRTVDLGKVSLTASLRPRVLHLEPANLKVGESFRRTLAVENGPAQLSVSGLPDGLSFNPNTETISGAPTQAGPFLAKISARGAGDVEISDTLEFQVESLPLEKVPRVSDGHAKVYSGETFRFKIEADGSPTSYSAEDLPEGLSVDSSTGRISGKADETGIFSVMLYASNAAGRGSGKLELEVVERHRTRPAQASEQPAPSYNQPAPAYAYTFYIAGFVFHATNTGQIVDMNGTVVGQVIAPVMQYSVMQLSFGAYGSYGFLHAFPDGNLVAYYANGSRYIRGTWHVGGN